MKALKITLLALVALALVNKAQAQGKYGKDSADCVKSLNFYLDEYKKDNYKAAFSYWKDALRYCPPEVNHNLYIHGATIMRHYIASIKDSDKRMEAIDTLLMMYDRRMKHFKVNKSDILYRRADVIEEYNPTNAEAIYDAFRAVVDSDPANSDIHAAAKSMIEARKLYESKKIDADKFTDIYTQLSEVADQRIKAKVADTTALNEAKSCKAAIENAFLSTDAATCENLIKLFTPRFQANSSDLNTVRMIVGMLGNRDCTKNDLYFQAAEAYHKLDPSAGSAYTLGKMFFAKGDMEKSVEYYKDAIGKQTDATDKAKYMIELASILLGQGQNGQALSYAKQSLGINPNNGQAYIIIAEIYAGVKGCGDNNVSRRSVFWAAVDQLARAKQVDPSLADDVNKRINIYVQHFPSYDDCFDLDIIDGQSYTVNCGVINERTIVRTRK